MRAGLQVGGVPGPQRAIDHSTGKGAADRQAKSAWVVADAILQLIAGQIRQCGAATHSHDPAHGLAITWALDRQLQQAGGQGWRRNHSLDRGLGKAVADRPVTICDWVDLEGAFFDLVGRGVLGGQLVGSTHHADLSPKILFWGERWAIFSEPMLLLFWAGQAGLRPRVDTDGISADPGRRGERQGGFVRMGQRHKLVPNRASTRYAGDIDHRRTVGVADPDPCDQLWRIPYGQVVPKIIGGSCLDRSRAVQPQQGIGAEDRRSGRIVAQNVGKKKGVYWADDLCGSLDAWLAGTGGSLGTDEHALNVCDLLDRDGGKTLSGIGQDSKGTGQFEQRDFASPQCQAQAKVRAGQGRDAQALHQFQIGWQGRSLQRSHCWNIAAGSQGRTQRDQPQLSVVVVGWHIGGVGAVGERGGDVGQQRPGRPLFLRRTAWQGKGCQIDKRFGGAAGLAGSQRHIDLPIDLHVVKVRAADQSHHFAGLRPQRHQRPIRHVAVGDRTDLLAHDLFGCCLQTRVQRGVDRVASLVERFRAQKLFQLLTHQKRKMRGLEVELQRFVRQRRLPGCIGFRRREKAGFHHQAQHNPLASLGTVGLGIGVVICWQLGQPSQQRRFRQRQVSCFLAEIGLCGGVDPIGKISIINLIEIQLQDLLFAVAPGDFSGQNRLFDLAGGTSFWAEQHALDQLLCDGRCAGDDVAFLKRIIERTQQGDRVDSWMCVEIGVLGSDRCLDHGGGNRRQRNFNSPPGIGVEGFVEQIASAVVDSRRLKCAGALAQFRRCGQVARHQCIASQQSAGRQQSQQHKRQRAGRDPLPETIVRAGGACHRASNRVQLIHGSAMLIHLATAKAGYFGRSRLRCARPAGPAAAASPPTGRGVGVLSAARGPTRLSSATPPG